MTRCRSVRPVILCCLVWLLGACGTGNAVGSGDNKAAATPVGAHATPSASAGRVPNPDTEVLERLKAANNGLITESITLRQGEQLHPLTTSAGELAVTANRARTVALAVGFVRHTSPVYCVAAALTARDIFRPSAKGNKLLYRHAPVWVCFQTRMPGGALGGGVGPNGARRPESTGGGLINTVTYVDATTGQHLFTDEDGV